MGVRILHDTRSDEACLYCSTSDWAFGPVFQAEGHRSAEERAEAFLRWLRIDPREITDQAALERKYAEWRAQEAQQFKSEEEAHAV